MAAVTSRGSTWNTTAGNKTVTATPALGDLMVVVAASSGLAGGTTSVTDDQGGTYTQVDSDRTGFSTTGVLTVWIRDALVTSAVSTIYTANQAGSTGGGLSVLSVAGMLETGAAAVRSNGGQSTGGAGTTPAPVLSQAPLFSNPIITAVGNGTNGGGTTARAGYSDVAIAGYNTPTTGLDLCFLDGGETTDTITWGGTSATAFASVAIELDAPPPVYASIYATTSPVPDLLVRAPSYRLSPPTVVTEEALFIAEPIRTYFRVASRLRPPLTVSVLGRPAVEEEVPPPDLSGENLAPNIYGYGAM